MWHVSNHEKTKLNKAENEMRDAQRFLKWVPWIGLAGAASLVFAVFKTMQHPSLEHLLNLGVMVSFALNIYGDWRKAQAKVNGLRDGLADSIGMVALTMLSACLVLGSNDIARDKATFNALGCLFLVMFLCMLEIAIRDVLRERRKRVEAA